MAKKKQSRSGPPAEVQERPADFPLLPLDPILVSRLLLGVLSEHEQRRLLVRLLEVDSAARKQLAPFLEPLGLSRPETARELSRIEAALTIGMDSEVARTALLAADSERDLDELLRAYSLEDFFRLGAATRRLFSWSVAERLLQRARQRDLDPPTRKTSFFLATMVTDGLEILATAGILPPCPRTIADLRQRLEETGGALPATAYKPLSRLAN